MHIALITPEASPRDDALIRMADRWAAYLRGAGHTAARDVSWHGQDADLLIATDDPRHLPIITRWSHAHPTRPLVIVLGSSTATDAQHGPQNMLRLAHRLVLLQTLESSSLATEWHGKTRVIYPSSPALMREIPTTLCDFLVLLISPLNEACDPFRVALASAYLPEHSRIRIHHYGAAHSAGMALIARRAEARLPRYHWHGEAPHDELRRQLLSADVLIHSAPLEGVTPFLNDALAAGLPVIASLESGKGGLLGQDYSGYFPAGDEARLARQISRAEHDPDYYGELSRQSQARGQLMTPEREAQSLRQLVAEFETRW
jgi:hypothetical protein